MLKSGANRIGGRFGYCQVVSDLHSKAAWSCKRSMETCDCVLHAARLATIMEDAARFIRASVGIVEHLRLAVAADQRLAMALASVKRYQSKRFEHNYRDLIVGGPYQNAVRFFLDELYGLTDYSNRDAQFARIAGAIDRLLPKLAVETAVALARLHVLTEQLDFAMAQAWLMAPQLETAAERYLFSWRSVGQSDMREQQLRLVIELGRNLERLTRTPGLRLLLKMMRNPAHAAGLHELQHFLESGFDTFASLAKRNGASGEFLRLIESRESQFVGSLFDPRFDIASALRDDILPAGSIANQ